MAKDLQQLFGWARSFGRTGRSGQQTLRAATSSAGNDPSTDLPAGVTVGTLSEIVDLPCIRQDDFAAYPASIDTLFGTEPVPTTGEPAPSAAFDSIVSRARALSERKEWAELQRCAEQICAGYPNRPDGYLMAWAAQVGLGQDEAAEAVLAVAMTNCPDDERIAIEHAWLAHNRRDWAEAKRRWGTIRESFRNRIEGHIGLGIAQRETACFDEADASFTETIVRFPNDQAALIEFAWVAHNRGDLVEARRRWTALRDRFPDNRFGYVGAGVSERAAGDTAAADRLLAEGHARFPADEGIAVAYGWMANLRDDCDAAFTRLTSLKLSFPGNEEIGRALDVAWQAIEQREASAAGDHEQSSGAEI